MIPIKIKQTNEYHYNMCTIMSYWAVQSGLHCTCNVIDISRCSGCKLPVQPHTIIPLSVHSYTAQVNCNV